MWRNWAGDQHCAPAAVERPGSSTEVSAAVQRAAAAGRTIRAVGAGHSFSDVALSDGHLLHLDRMDRVLDVDRGSGLVRVEAGISIFALNERLHGHGLALENLGDIDRQSIAGAISTATHGTGARLRNISSQVAEVEMVLADGSVRSCGEDDAETLSAARVGLGALGILTAVTLRCVPAFNLHAVDTTAPLDAVLDRIDELVDGNDHFEFFTFPHSPLALTRTNNRTDRPPVPATRARGWVDEVLLGEHVFRTLCATGRRIPAAIPRLNRLVSRAFGTTDRVERSYRIFASPRHVRFTEMEYAIPRESLVTAVRCVRELVQSRRLPVNFPLEVRVVAPDDAFLSTAHERPTAYVAVHVFRGMEWRQYFRAVEEIMDDLGGRPHWGKRHFQTAETLRPRFPRWDDFQAVRARLDPEGRFANRYTDRVLGRVDARAPAAA